MKTLLGVLLVASFIHVHSAAQQKNDQQVAPDLHAKIESMMKSEFQRPLPTNDDKIEAKLGRKPRKVGDLFSIPTVVIDGAVYISVGDTLIPWPGGGASGCFDPTGIETTARIERARAEWAKRPKKN